MRTAVCYAASPRRLPWQAAFTTNPHQASSPVVWQHVFVSDIPMTNWSAGSSLLLRWDAEKGLAKMQASGPHSELSACAGNFALDPSTSD
jgi:hypothetical protein